MPRTPGPIAGVDYISSTEAACVSSQPDACSSCWRPAPGHHPGLLLTGSAAISDQARLTGSSPSRRPRPSRHAPRC